MKKRLKRLLNKKGLSLVEVLVVLFVSSILIGCAMGMLTPVNNLMNSLKGNAHLDTMCDTANEYIRGKLQNAASITIKTYTIGGSTTAIENQVDAYKNKTAVDYEFKVKALAVLKNPNGDFRLYDFDEVTKATIGGLVSGTVSSSTNSDNNYGVFNEPFYENTSYIMTFTNKAAANVTDADGNVIGQTTDWIKIASQSHKTNASGTLEPANQPKTLAFKTLGGGLDFGGNDAPANIYDETNKKFDLSHMSDGFVVIYVTKDFTAAVTTTASP